MQIPNKKKTICLFPSTSLYSRGHPKPLGFHLYVTVFPFFLYVICIESCSFFKILDLGFCYPSVFVFFSWLLSLFGELDMWGSGMNLITTIIGFGMSATFIVFICTRIICGRLRRIESRQMFEIESGIDLEQPEHRINGLEPALVAAIPTMKFNYEAFSSVEDTQCSICLGEYQEKEVLRIMPKCGHNFHLSCIDVWLRKQSTCPVCRLPLQDTIEKKHTRLATVSMVQSVNSPETSIEHSSQWLLPGPERSVGNGSNQGHLDSITVNTEQTSQESETRH